MKQNRKIIANYPEDKYHASDGISSTAMKNMLKSPAHYKAYLDERHKFKGSARMDVGSYIHCAVLQPELLTEKFIFEPNGLRSNEGRPTRDHKEWEKSVGNKIILKQINTFRGNYQDWQVANLCAASIMSNKTAMSFINRGNKELSVWWNDPVTDLLCKARGDVVGDRFIADIKLVSQGATEFQFQRIAANMKYYVQAGHYLNGFQKEDFYFICVEPFPPWAVKVNMLNDEFKRKGLGDVRYILNTIKQCQENDEWPAYGDEIGVVEKPRWM